MASGRLIACCVTITSNNVQIYRLVRWQVHRVVDNLWARLFGLLLVVVDIILVFVRLSETNWDLNSGKERLVRLATDS